MRHHHSIPWHVTPTDASTGGITVTLPLNETSGALVLGRRRALEDIGTGSLREGNVSRQKSKRDCFQQFTGSSRTDGLDKVEHSPVLQTIEAVAAGDDLVADVALQRGVLMEDGLPIGLDGADAARTTLSKMEMTVSWATFCEDVNIGRSKGSLNSRIGLTSAWVVPA